jgi:hypothetical protein
MMNKDKDQIRDLTCQTKITVSGGTCSFGITIFFFFSFLLVLLLSKDNKTTCYKMLLIFSFLLLSWLAL